MACQPPAHRYRSTQRRAARGRDPQPGCAGLPAPGGIPTQPGDAVTAPMGLDRPGLRQFPLAADPITSGKRHRGDHHAGLRGPRARPGRCRRGYRPGLRQAHPSVLTASAARSRGPSRQRPSPTRSRKAGCRNGGHAPAARASPALWDPANSAFRGVSASLLRSLPKLLIMIRTGTVRTREHRPRSPLQDRGPVTRARSSSPRVPTGKAPASGLDTGTWRHAPSKSAGRRSLKFQPSAGVTSVT